ncbi:MAG: hypothetical protein HY301_06505 [Verrucomicrobia bacterium]|nr:hypothetical protein [Verrucomicrobiota bacterium]
MKTEKTSCRSHRVSTIARFGAAHLCSDERGRVHLRGGSNEERVEALEFVSLFLHEVAVDTNSRPGVN